MNTEHSKKSKREQEIMKMEKMEMDLILRL